MIEVPTDIKQAEGDRVAALRAAVRRAEGELEDRAMTRGTRRRALARWRAANAELDQIATTGYVWSPGEVWPAEDDYINPEQ